MEAVLAIGLVQNFIRLILLEKKLKLYQKKNYHFNMNNLTQEETIVYDLIKNCNGKITQLQIARAAPQLGSHEKHEGYITKDSTVRKIRQIIRTLRIEKGIPILSSYGKSGGYFLLKSPEEAKHYIEVAEKMAKAQARAWFETYTEMKKHFEIRSDWFDKQGNLFE